MGREIDMAKLETDMTPKPKPQSTATTAAPDAAAASVARDARREALALAIDNATEAITAEIDDLIARATALKDWYIDDAARIKTSLKAHIDNGTRVVDIANKIDQELAQLEQARDELLKAQIK